MLWYVRPEMRRSSSLNHPEAFWTAGALSDQAMTMAAADGGRNVLLLAETLPTDARYRGRGHVRTGAPRTGAAALELTRATAPK